MSDNLGMTDMVRMGPEEEQALAQQMRMANTQRFKALLDALEPYVDGTLGPVSPSHVNSYIKVCRELGLLWHSYDRAAPVEEVKGVEEEVMVLSARQAAVLEEFRKLKAVGMANRARRAS